MIDTTIEPGTKIRTIDILVPHNTGIVRYVQDNGIVYEGDGRMWVIQPPAFGNWNIEAPYYSDDETAPFWDDLDKLLSLVNGLYDIQDLGRLKAKLNEIALLAEVMYQKLGQQ